MIANLPPATVFNYIVDDFEAAWDALVKKDEGIGGGGNFMFALLAMVLLEFGCRICVGNSRALLNLGTALNAIEPKHFTLVPGQWSGPSGCKLPGAQPRSHLLAMLFDLVRNGKAHQYESIIVTLSNGDMDIDIAGSHQGKRVIQVE